MKEEDFQLLIEGMRIRKSEYYKEGQGILHAPFCLWCDRWIGPISAVKYAEHMIAHAESFPPFQAHEPSPEQCVRLMRAAVAIDTDRAFKDCP